MTIKRIPILSEPTILPLPQAPDFTAPPVQVETLDQARYYLDACDDFKVAGQEDELTEEELKEEYPGIDLASACYWAVYGWNTQNWLTVESQMAAIANYVERLREQIALYVNELQSRYEATTRALEPEKEAPKP